YGFEHTYSRMVEAMGKSGDILFALSTSGNSPNILEAAKKAKEIGMQVISFSGANGGALKALSDLVYLVPSDDTARIQEIHITLGHILCEFIEQQIFA
ncbi:MAG: SIS domain-containing protein, partial [Saprospiraceae bacterium]